MGNNYNRPYTSILAPTYTALGDSPTADAFGRQRVGLPFTLFDQSFEFGIAQLFWNTATVGAGSGVAHDANTSNCILTADTGATDSCIRQTYNYFHYRPGKSHDIVLTFTFGTAVANVRRRVGYFDAQNGFFLEQNGTSGVNLVERSYVTGSVVDTSVAQTSWNVDKMDGHGPSGFTIDWTKGQILHIDLQWLGFGRVRFFLNLNGVEWPIHTINHANVISTPYTTTASLPVRYEITNTGVQGVTHTFRQGCSSVITNDGNQEEPAEFFSVNNALTAVAVTTRRAILSIRPKATVGPSSKVNRIPIELEEFTIRVGTNDCLYEIVYNPVFTGTPTWSDPTSQSGVEYSVHGDAAVGAFTGGITMQSGYAISGSGAARATFSGNTQSKLPIALDMNGANPIAVSLVVTAVTGTSNVEGSLSYKETR